jgi:O-antigen/teichoic acid export membrane protein
LLRSATQFSAATIGAQAAGLLRTYAAAKLLGPMVYGTWLGLRLIVDYGNNLHLGVIFGMHRDVPLLRGRQDTHGVTEAKETAFAFVLLTGCLGMVACMVASVMVSRPLERQILLAIGVVLLVNQLRSYYVTLLKAENRFREASVGSALGSVAALTSVPAIYYAGMPGFIWGLVGMLTVETGYLVSRAGVPAARLSWPMLKRLFSFGFVTTVTAFAAVLLSSIDRTVILELLDTKQLGFYSVAFIGATFIIGVATVPTAVLYPRLSELYGRTNRPSDLIVYVTEPIRIAGVGFALLIGAMMLAVPAVVRLFLPQYEQGVVPAQIAIFGNYAVAIVGLACNGFLALNWQKLYLAVTLVATGVTYLLARSMVHVVPGLTGIAIGCCLGMFVYLVLGIFGAYYAMERPWTESLRVCGIALAPIVYVGAAVVAIDWVLARWTPLSVGSIGQGLCAEVLFGVVMLPWLVAVGRSLLKRSSNG